MAVGLDCKKVVEQQVVHGVDDLGVEPQPEDGAVAGRGHGVPIVRVVGVQLRIAEVLGYPAIVAFDQVSGQLADARAAFVVANLGGDGFDACLGDFEDVLAGAAFHRSWLSPHLWRADPTSDSWCVPFLSDTR
jgi:hypothetical protein